MLLLNMKEVQIEWAGFLSPIKKNIFLIEYKNNDFYTMNVTVYT